MARAPSPACCVALPGLVGFVGEYSRGSRPGLCCVAATRLGGKACPEQSKEMSAQHKSGSGGPFKPSVGLSGVVRITQGLSTRSASVSRPSLEMTGAIEDGRHRLHPTHSLRDVWGTRFRET